MDMIGNTNDEQFKPVNYIRYIDDHYFDPSSKITIKRKTYGGWKWQECTVVENCRHHVVLNDGIYNFSVRKADIYFREVIE